MAKVFSSKNSVFGGCWKIVVLFGFHLKIVVFFGWKKLFFLGVHFFRGGRTDFPHIQRLYCESATPVSANCATLASCPEGVSPLTTCYRLDCLWVSLSPQSTIEFLAFFLFSECN